jgi:hypothetical protein
MSKTIRKLRQKKHRNIEVLDMLLHCKGRPMRDRRERRTHEKKSYLKEYYEDIYDSVD